MRRDIIDYLVKCLECQHIKLDPQHPLGLIHPLPILELKWEVIALDFFIIGLPRSKRKNYSVMVVMDKNSKTTHFIPVQSTYKTVKLVDIFMREIFRSHGIPKVVISDKDVKFTYALWKFLFEALGTQVQFSTSYHPYTDG